MGQSVSVTSFRRVGEDEPHASRRREILKAHPEIRNLYGPDIRLFYWIVFLVSLQLLVAWNAWRMPGWAFFVVAYAFGGTINHALSLANHELSHNLAFETPVLNELLAMFSNFAHGLPTAITFKRYHLEHHYFQGSEKYDTDIPTEFEGRVFNTTFRKLIWVILQPIFYATRPWIVRPLYPSKMEILNALVCFTADYWLCKHASIWALVYLIGSTLLGMGLHPVAGHFISEHYQFVLGQETYSYYGPLNYLCFNVGYHNEHHDFPKISGFQLPLVTKIAPEFYDGRWKNWDGQGLAVHTSWIAVIYRYITMPNMGPYARIKRVEKNSVKKAA